MVQKKSDLREALADTREALVEELKAAVAQAEEAMRSAADEQFVEKARAVRAQLKQSLAELDAGMTHTRRQLQAGVDAAGERVRDNPLAAVGIAAGVGLLLGLLLKRRR